MSEVSDTKDGHPSGRHMIDAYRMMATAARTSGGKHQKDIAEVYELAALCIENEAKRADRAEALLSERTTLEVAALSPRTLAGSGKTPNPPGDHP